MQLPSSEGPWQGEHTVETHRPAVLPVVQAVSVPVQPVGASGMPLSIPPLLLPVSVPESMPPLLPPLDPPLEPPLEPPLDPPLLPPLLLPVSVELSAPPLLPPLEPPLSAEPSSVASVPESLPPPVDELPPPHPVVLAATAHPVSALTIIHCFKEFILVVMWNPPAHLVALFCRIRAVALGEDAYGQSRQSTRRSTRSSCMWRNAPQKTPAIARDAPPAHTHP